MAARPLLALCWPSPGQMLPPQSVQTCLLSIKKSSRRTHAGVPVTRIELQWDLFRHAWLQMQGREHLLVQVEGAGP